MIEIQDLHKTFKDHRVLNGVNLKIPQGKITVILGPSGVGKSVLLKMMIGLLYPDRGKVLVGGTNIAELTGQKLNEFRRRFGMLFQSAALFDSLTVEENVAFPIKEHTHKSAAEITTLAREKLSLVGLTEAYHKYPAELSGGMRKRVGLARAIALEPEIILYDEPTTGLDPLTRDAINELILATQQKLHITNVIISHDIESTFQVADLVAMLHEGRIIEAGSPAQFRQSRHTIVQRFIARGTA